MGLPSITPGWRAVLMTVEVGGNPVFLPRSGETGTVLSFSYYGFGSKRAWRMSLAPGQLGQRSRKVAYRKLGRFTGTTSVRADRRGRLETTSCRCLAKGKF